MGSYICDVVAIFIHHGAIYSNVRCGVIIELLIRFLEIVTLDSIR